VWRGLDNRLPVWFAAETSTIAIVGAQVVTHLATNGGGSSYGHGAIEIIGVP